MKILDYFVMAFNNIRSAKLRSMLTSLGIIIGVGSVVLILAISGGVSASINGTFSDLGSTRLTISPSAPVATDSAAPRSGFGGGGDGGPGGISIASTLTVEDAAAVQSIDGVAVAAPVVQVATKVIGPAQMLDIGVTGTTPEYGQATGQELLSGRIFALDAAELVLNEAAAKSLFGDVPAVGQSVLVADTSYTVVGLFANEAPTFGPGAADTASPAVYMPIGPVLSIAATARVAQIVATADSPEVVDATLEKVRLALLERHAGVQDFAISSFQQLQSSFTQIFDILTVFLAAIAGISLLVGGIGIMNIMLVTVSERTREIGIAKAIGATRRNVVVQFLTEAVTLSLIGGVIGLLVAWLGTLLLAQLFALPAEISVLAVTLSVGVSALIGIIFGVLPAWRASRLDPIVALRHE